MTLNSQEVSKVGQDACGNGQIRLRAPCAGEAGEGWDACSRLWERVCGGRLEARLVLPHRTRHPIQHPSLALT